MPVRLSTNVISAPPRPPSSHEPQMDGDEAIALDEAMLALLVRSQARHGKAGRSGSLRTSLHGSGGSGGSCSRQQTYALPAQEDEASRAAQIERQGERQRKDKLYGNHASDVRALEALLNASFDRAARTQMPPMWPSVPLQ